MLHNSKEIVRDCVQRFGVLQGEGISENGKSDECIKYLLSKNISRKLYIMNTKQLYHCLTATYLVKLVLNHSSGLGMIQTYGALKFAMVTLCKIP